MKQLWAFIIVILLSLPSVELYSSEDASSMLKNKQNNLINSTEAHDIYLIILNDGHKAKDLIGYDISNNGQGIITRKMIKRLFGKQTNFKRKKKKLEKKLLKAKDPKKIKRIKKRIKKIEKRIKTRKKMKNQGKLDYKEKIFSIKINSTIPDHIALKKLREHPAIKNASKDQKVSINNMPNDPLVTNPGTQDWRTEGSINLAIRTANDDPDAYRFEASTIETMWYLKTIKMHEVWAMSQPINGDGVVVAVIDSGLTTNHEDIIGNIWTNDAELGDGKESNGIDDDPFDTDINRSVTSFTTEYIDDWQGWNYVTENNTITDDNGHGTHVIGTIAAVGNNGKGIIGIAPSANIMVLRTLAGNGSGRTSSTIAAIDYAINQGADVINMSLGTSTRQTVSMDDVANIIRDHLFNEANSLDIVICIAAGNNRAQHEKTGYQVPGEIFNTDLTEAYSPAWFSTRHDNIITVAATTWESNGKEYLSNFSNFSSRHSEKNPITLAAPGVRIYSMKNKSHDQYIDKQGTSMATPVVAGLVALVKGINSDLTASEIVNLIKETSDSSSDSDIGNTNYTGAGRVNAKKLISAALNSSISITNPINNSISLVPTINIQGKTKANTSLQIYINNSPYGSKFNSGIGQFNEEIVHPSDGIVEIKVAGELNEERVTSDPINITFDIFKPKISTSISKDVITPTFNISGKTEPNRDVSIYKKEQSESTFSKMKTIGTTISNANGEFNITVNPHPNNYNASFEVIASASVNVSGIQKSKSSEPVSITTRIPNYPPNITTPNTNEQIFSSTFNIKGTTTKNIETQLLNQSNTIISTMTTGENGIFSFTIDSPFSEDEIEESYTVSANVFGWVRQSNPITLRFNRYKPTIRPPLATPITSSPFNIQGQTQALTTVNILHCETTNCETTKLITQIKTNDMGTFETPIHYFDHNLKTEAFIMAQATVNISSNEKKVKQSDPIKFKFNIGNILPTLTPLNHPSKSISVTIHSPILTLRGTAEKNTSVTLNEDTVAIKTTQTDSNGHFSFTIPSPTIAPKTRDYTINSIVYDREYTSNTLTINFDVNEHAPLILYPTENIKNISPQLTFRGISPKNSPIYLYRYNNKNNHVMVKIGTSNHLGQWTLSYPALTNGTEYFISETVINGKSYYSNDVRIINEKDPYTPQINSPKNLEEITTSSILFSGTGEKNATIYLYTHLNQTMDETAKLIQTKTPILTNNTGEWATTIPSFPNKNQYFVSAVLKKEGYQATSNSIAFKMNYDFESVQLKFNTPKDNHTTNRKTIPILGESPNGTLRLQTNHIIKTSPDQETINTIKTWDVIVTNNAWKTIVDLPLNDNEYYGIFEITATITHEKKDGETTTQQKSITITRDSTPKITTPKKSLINTNKINLNGTGKEFTVLTITKISQSTLSNNQIFQTQPSELIIGKIVTDENGNWSMDVPISSPGEYQFKIYENYGKENEFASTANYNLTLMFDDPKKNTALNIGPNPFNPTLGPLTIETVVGETSQIDIGIYSIGGYKIHNIHINNQSIGKVRRRWDGRVNGKFIQPGLYLIVMKASGKETIIKTKRMGVKW